jgi:hypothetical protein
MNQSPTETPKLDRWTLAKFGEGLRREYEPRLMDPPSERLAKALKRLQDLEKKAA